ncbi:hypothetical protein [Mumia quercus]|uniref:hypothetical protein n=1 Tax=Mumia quercus TaxID=2976125 RepID=UPI0021D0F843|nr:hypothetical protein [Mumia quercus]
MSTCERTEPTRHETVTTHEHGWRTESRHVTSEGTIHYVRCSECGVRRVDLLRHPDAPPVAASREVGVRSR